MKKGSIRNQAIALMIIIALWITGMLSTVLNDMSDQRALDDHLKEMSLLTLELNDYYQSAIEQLLNNPSLDESEALYNEKQSKLLKTMISQVEEIKVGVDEIELAVTIRKDLDQSFSLIGEYLKKLHLDGQKIGPSAYLNRQGEYLKRVIYEIDASMNLMLEEQNILRAELQNKLMIGSAVLVLLFLFTSGWLLIYKTLTPLREIKTIFTRSGENYHGHELKIQREDEIGDLIDSYNYLQRRTVTVERLIRKLNEHDHFEEILEFIFDNFSTFIPYNRIGIAVLSSDKKEIRALSARSDRKLRLGKNYSYDLNETSLKSIIESGEPRILNDLKSYYDMKPSSESTKLILEEGMQSSVTLPLRVRNECVGVVFFSSVNKMVYKDEHIRFLKTIAESLAAAFDQSFLNDQLLVSTIHGFAKLVESKDSETGNHIERMQRYSVLIAELLSVEDMFRSIINEQFIKQIRDFSPLHDIGKVAVPDHILLKPGKLSAEEFVTMKSHVELGADILRNMNDQIHGENREFYRVGIEIVRHHHEKYDGSGYPDKLAGDEIPLSARIVALADVFDALMSKRPYKEAYAIDKAKSILFEGRGSHFDPSIIDVVMKHWNRFEEQVELFKDQEENIGMYLIS